MRSNLVALFNCVKSDGYLTLLKHYNHECFCHWGQFNRKKKKNSLKMLKSVYVCISLLVSYSQMIKSESSFPPPAGASCFPTGSPHSVTSSQVSFKPGCFFYSHSHCLSSKSWQLPSGVASQCVSLLRFLCERCFSLSFWFPV